MPLNVGDAVLTFLGDTTQLDQACARVEDNVDRSMSAAADSVDQVGDSLKEVSFELDATASNAPYAGGMISDAMTKAKASTGEARGEAMLLGEAFGIHLPRHVTSFVAKLPGVGTALQSAFAATAVLFLLDALVKGSEKLSEWISNTFIFTQAMKDSDQAVKDQNKTLLQLAAQLDKDTEALEKFGKTQSEIKSDKVSSLRDEIAKSTAIFQAASKAAKEYATQSQDTVSDQLLEKTANLGGYLGTVADMYVRIGAGIQNTMDSLLGLQTVSEKAAEDARKAGQKAEATAIENAKKVADEKVQLRLAEKAAAAQAVADQEDAAKKLIAMGETIGSAKIKQWAAQAKYEAGFAQDSAAALLRIQQEQADKEYQLKLQTLQRERAIEQQAAGGYNAAGDEAAAKKQIDLVKETNAKIEALTDEHHAKAYEQMKAANDAYATKVVEAAKMALDVQLRGIEDFKKAQLDAYAAGKAGIGSWEAAQVHAADAAAIAHQDYLKKVIAVYTEQGEAQKAQAHQQQLAALQTEAEAKATERLSAAMGKLASATKEATDAERKLAEDTISQHFKDQETAITKLAAMHLITEQQKDDRLKLLEEQQASETLKILDDSLKAQQKLRDAAEARLNAAKSNPASTKSELTDLQAELAKEVAAVAKAEDAKLQAKEKFNQVSEQNDKSHYGRALLMAMANGNEILAEQLRQNHAALLAAQQERDLAKARGVDTTAIEQKIKALKQNDTELQKEANGGKLVTAQLQKNVQQALLAAQAELVQAKARGQNVTAIEQEIVQLQKLEKLMQQEPARMKQAQTAMQGLRMATGQLKDEMKAMEQQMSQAFATAIIGAIASGKSIGAALEAATKAMLLNLAEQALAKAIYYTAEGIAAATMGDPQASGYFAAAAEFGLVAGAAGAVGMAMPGGGSGSGSAAAGPTPGQSSSTNLGGGSGGTVGVTKLAGGGVVSRKTNVMIGDSPSGGDAEEAILPLSDPRAMGQIARAIMAGIPPPQQESGSEPGGMDRMLEAISTLTGTRQTTNEPGHGFSFAPPATGATPGFQFSGSTAGDKPEFSSSNGTVGEALGFPDRAPAFPAEKAAFSFASPAGQTRASEFEKSPSTVGEALGFDASPVSTQTPTPDFHSATSTEPAGRSFERTPASIGDARSFTSAPATVGETLGFDTNPASPQASTPNFQSATSKESPAPTFSSASQPEPVERSPFNTAEASPGKPPAFESKSSTVGEALGFTSAQPTATDQSVFSSGSPRPDQEKEFAAAQPSGSAVQPPISAAQASPSAQQEFKVSESTAAQEKQAFSAARPPQAQTLGFVSSAATVGEALGFSSAASSSGEKPEFSRSAASDGAPRKDFQFAEASAAAKPVTTPVTNPVTAVTPVTPVTPTVGERLGFDTAAPSPREAARFTSEKPSSSEKPDFAFAEPGSTQAPAIDKPAPQTVGEALGFTRTSPSVSGKQAFSAATPSPGEKRDFRSRDASESNAPDFTRATPTSSSVEKDFRFAEGTTGAKHDFPLGTSKTPTVGDVLGFTASLGTPSPREAAGFTSGEPSPGEKPRFNHNEPTESEEAAFLAAQPTVSTKPGFDSSSAPTVGEALGFKFDTPYPGEKPVFHASEPSAPEKPGFTLSEPSARQQRDFEAARPQTVGDALGFGFSQPSPSHANLGFTSGQPSTTATRGFGSGVASPHEKQPLDVEPSTPGERPGFNYSAPSIPREMPDMESLASNFGGLLSQSTLRSASNSQAPSAAVAAGSSVTPMDVEARMEKFAARLGAQVTPEGKSSAPETGGDVHIHMPNLKGVISPESIKKVFKQAGRMVQNRQLTINASNSLRVTKRSQ